MPAPTSFVSSLQKLKFILRLSGLTFESKKLTRMNKFKLRCLYIFNFLWLNTDLLGGVFWFIDGVQTGKTFLELTYLAPCLTYSLLANLKTIYLIHYEDFLCDLCDSLLEIESKDITRDIDAISKNELIPHHNLQRSESRADEDNSWTNGNNESDGTKYNIREHDVKFLYLMLKCSNMLCTLLLATFIASPLCMMALKYTQTKEMEFILPFLVIYPFDSYDIKYWPFVYLHQFWSGCVVLLYIGAVDYLLYVCCTHIGVQFRLLRHDIEHLIEKNRVLMVHELEEFQEDCIELIKKHQEIIRLASVLQLIYSESTLINFVTSSIIICLTGFNVVAIESVAFAVTFLVFLSASLMQIYMLCFFGEFLMKSSIEVSDAVFNCKWYYLNSDSGKIMLFVQRRAQKPCKLTAFRFSDVNLKAFMNILSSAWSYFALLITLYNPQK